VREQVRDAIARGGHGKTVQIVAVTKGHSLDAVLAAVSAGLNDIGENRVQEALDKQDRIEGGIRWHLIGHLQRNKVKHLHRFHMFHALDSDRLAGAIDAAHHGAAPIRALVQVNVSHEPSKGGFTLDVLDQEADRLAGMRALSIQGVMTMAPLGATEVELRRVFGGARQSLEVLRRAGHPASELSMGMSDDFVVAAEEGATLVRLGTVLFGERTT
jgi:hypothetical protein